MDHSLSTAPSDRDYYEQPGDDRREEEERRSEERRREYQLAVALAYVSAHCHLGRASLACGQGYERAYPRLDRRTPSAEAFGAATEAGLRVAEAAILDALREVREALLAVRRPDLVGVSPGTADSNPAIHLNSEVSCSLCGGSLLDHRRALPCKGGEETTP